MTDNQYAVMDGGFQHLPRGVDQYLELRKKQQAGGSAPAAKAAAKPSGLSGAELRNAQKEFAAAGRKMEKLNGQIVDVHSTMATHDQNDYTGLGKLSDDITALQKQLDEVETRWLELEELLA